MLATDFPALYASPWHHPVLCWAGTFTLLVGVAAARRVRFLTTFVVVFGLEIAADAWFTGAWPPIAADHVATQPLAIAFVILGDWRFFVLTERFVHRTRSLLNVLLIGAGFALLVPLCQGIATRVFPATFAEPRHTFLAYEALFVALALVWRFLVLPRRLGLASPRLRRYVLGLAEFEAVQYALWAVADLLILQGQEWALALRIVPNLLYYTGFLAFAALMAPREELR